MQMVEHEMLLHDSHFASSFIHPDFRATLLQLFVWTVAFNALLALNRIRVLAGTSSVVWSRGFRATRGLLSYVENDPSPEILIRFFSANV
jgi:hypothetical protein